MIRTCPKCGDYYADALLAFCLADGAPLVNVDPRGESWSECARVIEEKENALSKQKRKLKWRRVVMSAMTMLIATMVVCVVAVNSFIYLKPKPEEVAPAKPPTSAKAPVKIVATNVNTPTRDTKSPTPSRSPSASASLITDCSDYDQRVERAAIIKILDSKLHPNIETDGVKTIVEKNPAGLPRAEATLDANHDVSFKGCTAYATVTYSWQVIINGTKKSVGPRETKHFTCKKKGRWRCS
jgi:cytoskeletal protein RodZ